MKTIPITGKKGAGLFAIVDDDIYELVKKHKWSLAQNYAHIKLTGNITVALHHLPIGRPIGKLDVDHINRNTLDCRRENLRFVTRAQNSMNKGKNPRLKNASSKYKGVCFDKSRGLWISGVKYNYRRINLGRYKDEVDAAIAYNKKAVELFGEFAYLNEIP